MLKMGDTVRYTNHYLKAFRKKQKINTVEVVYTRPDGSKLVWLDFRNNFTIDSRWLVFVRRKQKRVEKTRVILWERTPINIV